ncbi:MAG: hypothetical protein J6328_00615, partial [Bacilli bacterium]|nr:hypothetical protein [Bacilli bacterium]
GEDQVPKGHEKMDAPFGLLRGKLRWTSMWSVVMMVSIRSSKLGTHQKKDFLFHDDVSFAITYGLLPFLRV